MALDGEEGEGRHPSFHSFIQTTATTTPRVKKNVMSSGSTLTTTTVKTTSLILRLSLYLIDQTEK